MNSPTPFRNRPALVGLAFLLAGAGAAAVWFYLPAPKMVGYAVFHIRAKPEYIFRPAGDDEIDFDRYRRMQAAQVKSRLVLNATVSHPDVANVSILRRQSEPLKWLENELKVDFESGPELMRVSLHGDNADEIKAILEALTAAYLKDVLSKDTARRRARFSTLEKHYRKYEDTLQMQRKRFRSLAETLTPADTTDREKHLLEEIADSRKQLSQLTRDELKDRSELTVHESIVAALAEAPIPPEEVGALLQADPNYQKLFEKQRSTEFEIDEVKKKVKEPGMQPLLASQEKELARAREELKTYAAQMEPIIARQIRMKKILAEKEQIGALEKRIQLSLNFRKALEEYIKEHESGTNGRRNVQVDLDSVKSQIAQTEKMAARILEEMESMRPELETVGRVGPMEPPFVEPYDDTNRRLIYSSITGLAILILLGLLAACQCLSRARCATHALPAANTKAGSEVVDSKTADET